ncbi:MAG TPA: hypothetical protein DF712_19805 [Balneola sp.]|jgi:hypothetical protein|nr:hypothetical protein [Bacteroidota bacterium]HCI72016.1 hypothetical protein [Balneola sp.]HCT54695.1 hypothetical protein [Balneola sp.]|tara:strand:+ start:2869 stop:3519 length:651 start_codon:yes stop_codon:yes gene_type:complete
MKYITLIIVTLATLFSCSSSEPAINTDSTNKKDFSGKIVYQYDFRDTKSGNNITDQLSGTIGSEQHYFINSNNYKAFDEDGNLVQLYNAESNKYYFPNPNTGKIMEIDGSFMMSEIISVTKLEGTETILGKTCKILVVATKTDETTYFYSDEIAVDPSNFSQHKFGGWSEYMKASNGALPLKYILKNEQYTWTSTAVEITRMEIAEEEFVLETILN